MAPICAALRGNHLKALVLDETEDRWRELYRKEGPAELRPIGEVEFAAGAAAMAAGRCA